MKRARNAGLANPKWGAIPYGKYSQQYVRLQRAIAIDMQAALLSGSYGSFQIMGFNYELAGYDSVEAMIAAFKVGEVEQIRGVINFIKANPAMFRALLRGDWKTFARLYNGPGYRKNKYDTKLAAAYRLALSRGTADSVAPEPVAPAEPDETVREAQGMLIRLGYSVGPKGADGWHGDKTEAAVRAFQRAHPDLREDGLIGPQTIAALEAAVDVKKVPTETPGAANGTAAAGAAGAVVATSVGFPWVAVGVLVVAALIAGVIVWRWRSNFAQEREWLQNARDGVTVHTAPWADRFRETLGAL